MNVIDFSSNALPDFLKKNLDSLFKKENQKELQKASEDVSKKYRTLLKKLDNESQSKAYVLTRLPATYAALRFVLSKVSEFFDFESVTSFLDVGAGPGTGLFALRSLWKNLSNVTFLEHHTYFKSLFEKLADFEKTPDVSWLLGDAQTHLKTLDNQAFDLSLLSYVLNESDDFNAELILEQTWQKTKNVLIVVETGTPEGFAKIKKARDFLIAHDAVILAPCFHQKTCPMSKDDWCHFSTRLNRSKFHISTKDAALTYEDEKFCYLVAAKSNFFKKDFCIEKARVVKKPMLRSGHMVLDLCYDGTLKRKTISKKEEHYRLARKIEWGDAYDM